MARVTIIAGDGPYGPSIMKFTLTYDGELRSNGKPQHKWEIRKHLSPQLEELWRVHPILIQAYSQRQVPLSRAIPTYTHHSLDPDFPPPGARNINYVDVCKSITVNGWEFIPLVRNSLALRCGLKITFL